MYGYGYRYAGSGSGKTPSIDPVVQTFVDDNSITDSTEINALNALYVGMNNVITDHGSGSILYLNGMSPTSITASREAIIYGSGKQTAVDVGATPTHSTNGVKFNGTSNAWNLGNYPNSNRRQDILSMFSRNNQVTVNGVQLGVRSVATAAGNFLFKCQTVTGTSGYNGNTYASTDFSMNGNWLGYQDGTATKVYKDGIKQNGTIPAPDPTVQDVYDMYLCARNNLGTADNFGDDEIGCVCVLSDGGTLFTQAEIEQIDLLVYNYNSALGRSGFNKNKKMLIADGNSLMFRSNAELTTAFDVEYGSANYELSMVAVGGQDANDGRLRVDAFTTPWLCRHRETIYFSQFGRNSLANGDSVADTLADIKAINSELHSKVPSCKNVAILTSASVDNAGTAPLSDIPTLNSQISSDVSGDFDQVYDLYNNGLGFDDYTNQPPFDPDEVHYSTAGETTHANWVAEQIADNNP